MSLDIIVGTESWLSPDVADSEVFPVDLSYTVFRRDRVTSTRGSGVFILVRKQFTVFRVPELETDCELLWVKTELLGGKPLYVVAYYKPEESDEHSLLELNSSLSQFAHIKVIPYGYLATSTCQSMIGLQRVQTLVVETWHYMSLSLTSYMIAISNKWWTSLLEGKISLICI